MANLKLGQDVDNKRERKQTTVHIGTKSYPLQIAVKMCRQGSLIKINPSALKIRQASSLLYEEKIWISFVSRNLSDVENRHFIFFHLPKPNLTRICTLVGQFKEIQVFDCVCLYSYVHVCGRVACGTRQSKVRSRTMYPTNLWRKRFWS